MTLKAPFPYFGGKSKVAPEVWAALGDVDNYIEPFAGSLAVLLGRPRWHRGDTETVNDKDEYLANFWRALADNPDLVAHYADWPVNEADLFSRHMWLVQTGKAQMQAGMQADPEWYDAKIAGWWVWGIAQWIGSGWCSGGGPWSVDAGQLVHLGNAGQGVNRKRDNAEALYAYMQELATRLRRVRVCCGDWARVVTNGAMAYGSTVGVFLDPPYSIEANRDMSLYNEDSGDVAHAVRAWAIANGDNPRLRIVLCGYDGEHAMPASWREYAWKANGGYANNGDGSNQNKHKERLWFSPACLHVKPTLFEAMEL